MSVLPDPLTAVRLNARHGVPPMGQKELRRFCFLNITSADAVREAERLGRQDRATGVRCMCSFCEGNSNEVGGRERLRQHYAARRHAELAAQGTPPEQRGHVIEEEINKGAAFQAGPATVTRTQGAPE